MLYYHFRSKEHLYQELMLDLFNQTRKNLLKLSKYRGSLRERLILYVSSEFRNCRKDPNSVRLIFRSMFSPEGEYPRFNYVEEFKREREMIALFIQENIAENAIVESGIDLQRPDGSHAYSDPGILFYGAADVVPTYCGDAG